MAAQLQGVLTATRRAVGIAVVLGWAGCAGAAPASQSGALDALDALDATGAATPAPDPVPTTAAPASAPVVQDPVRVPAAGGFGPEILLPPASPGDDEVARVGDLVLRRSDAFRRLQTAHPKLALDAIDLLVFDVLVARHAAEFGIRVPGERVEVLAAAEEQQVRQQVAAELGKDVDLETYVWRLMGMRLEDWRATLRLRTAQRLYQGYVIRYLAMREDRVQVRFLVHKEQKVAREVTDKVRAGADFATLALRWSEDPTRRDGGLLPAFGRGFQHPVVGVAFTLQPGQVSDPFLAPFGDGERWFVVYCLEQLPGRSVAFDAVREQIDKDLVERPLSPLETSAYTLRWRAQAAGAAPRTPVDR